MNPPHTQDRKRQLSTETLRQENRNFAGTAGVSVNNRALGFIPAFMDTETSTVYLSRFENGGLAPIHLLTALPKSLFESPGTLADYLSIKSSVISGFVRENIFYSREEAARIATSGEAH